MADNTRRLLDLLAYLQTGRRFSGTELADRLQASPRTIRRDMERLRSYGYPVVTQPGPGGFYRLSAGNALPPMVFDDEEAVATVVGLGLLAATTADDDGATGMAAAADRAFGKIDQFLPKRLRAPATALRGTVEATAQSAPAIDADVLATLATAAARHEQVTFTYTTRTGTIARRRAEPYRQVHRLLRWYLLAWDLDRADWRTFRIDRIGEITSGGKRFTPRPLPAESAADYLRGALTAGRYRAVVTVAAPADRVADILRFQDCDIETLTGGRCRVTTWVDSFEWLILNLAFLDADFVIERPAEFRDRCRTLAERLSRAGTGP
ncbi:helix-turn-helix transcriptional regulator [Nocardia wallacei]|uniref:helix-turn-helix transcriptional regulator n=1 Tax=Nocardia wallacei TaxID=480035 RepID=UPI002457F548|nr:WYL domain-containing protein [Nocardia wallacei]